MDLDNRPQTARRMKMKEKEGLLHLYIGLWGLAASRPSKP